MSTLYSTQAGDTFDLISRRVYGEQSGAARIAAANPGAAEPFPAGVALVIPDVPRAPRDQLATAPAQDVDEVALLLGDQRFRYWGRVRIVRAMDAPDTIELGAPFNADLPGFRDIFRPLSYPSAEVTVGGEPLFSGNLVDILPSLGNTQRTISASGYSKLGSIVDCTPPASSFPLEFKAGQNLQQIAEALLAPFGLSAEFPNGAGAAFKQVACDPGRTVWDFLSSLAKQRNLVMASTPAGAVLFWKSVAPGSPVAKLQEGVAPVLSVAPSFNPQEYFSHVTGLEPVIVGLNGAQYTVKNPRLSGVLRPHTYEVSDTQEADLQTAVEAKAARMVANVASYAVRVPTWRTEGGTLWTPNTTLKLTAPDAMIYNEYEFLIRSVEFEVDRVSRVATLNLVLPGAFSGEFPETLPWE